MKQADQDPEGSGPLETSREDVDSAPEQEPGPHACDSDAIPENDVTPENPVETLARDLRAARRRAGDPTLLRLAYETGISKSALSDAFRGKRLPSLRTIEALAEALDLDPVEVGLRRRDILEEITSEVALEIEPDSATPVGARDDGFAEATLGSHAAPGPQPPSDLAKGAGPRRVGLATLITAIAATALVASSATGFFVWQWMGSRAGAAGGTAEHLATPSIALAVTGDDAALTECVNDAEVVADATRYEHYLLELIFSERCQAAWGRLTRYDDKAMGNSFKVSTFRLVNPKGPDRQTAIEADAQSGYTEMIVRRDKDDRICTSGSVTVDGVEIDLGDPICV